MTRVAAKNYHYNKETGKVGVCEAGRSPAPSNGTGCPFAKKNPNTPHITFYSAQAAKKWLEKTIEVEQEVESARIAIQNGNSHQKELVEKYEDFINRPAYANGVRLPTQRELAEPTWSHNRAILISANEIREKIGMPDFETEESDYDDDKVHVYWTRVLPSGDIVLIHDWKEGFYSKEGKIWFEVNSRESIDFRDFSNLELQGQIKGF